MPAWSAMTELGIEMLREIPGPLQEDPDFRAVIHCHAKEAERQEEMAAAVRDDCIPRRAKDRGLAWWEQYLGLPIRPELSEAQRRAVVEARLKRDPPLSSGLSWQEQMTALIGGGWIHEEHPDENKVTLVVPYPPGSELFVVAEERGPELSSWPCHLELEVVSVEGFILDLSELDEERFEAA